MTGRAMQGVFPILVTPFDEGSQIDEESLRRLIEFNLSAGVHGLGVALGSEVFKLTEAERAAVTRIVVDQVAGRVPVVINTGRARHGPGRSLQPDGRGERRRRADGAAAFVLSGRSG